MVRQRRYFALFESGLMYYRDEAGFKVHNPRGFIARERLAEVEAATVGRGSEDGRRFNMRVHGEARVVELIADSAASRDEWIRKLLELSGQVANVAEEKADAGEYSLQSTPNKDVKMKEKVKEQEQCADLSPPKNISPSRDQHERWNRLTPVLTSEVLFSGLMSKKSTLTRHMWYAFYVCRILIVLCRGPTNLFTQAGTVLCTQ